MPFVAHHIRAARRISPFRKSYPVPRERITPTPSPDWCCSQWQAYVERGQTPAARIARLRQVPQRLDSTGTPYRRRVISHVLTAFRVGLRL